MVKTEIKKIHKTEASSKAMRPFGASNTNDSNNNKNKKYKGVRMRSWGSWVSEIRAPNQKTRIWLGSYSTAEAAARAYDAALLCLKGSSANANLNFPSSSSLYIPQDTVLSPKSIQRVAAAAANNNTFEDNNNNAAISIATNSTSSSSNSSLISSPSSMSSSSPNSDFQIDDDVSLISPFDQPPNEPMAMMESWYGLEYGLESPKYFDQMLSGTFFDIDSTHLLDDLYEESDISLWSFS